MSTSAPVSPATLWGRIVVHNKLLTPRQWEECATIFNQKGGKIGIDQIVLKKGYLPEKAVAVVNKKVAEMLEKQKAPSAAESAAAPPPAPRPAPHASDREAAPQPRRARSDAAATHAPAHDDGTIPLEGVDDEHDAIWHPSDAEWVEAAASETSHDQRASARVEHDEAIPLEIVAGEGIKKIIKEGPALPLARPGSGSAALTRAPRKTAAGDDDEETQEDRPERVFSRVRAGQVDSEAFELLTQAVAMGASDLHLSSGSPPFVRVHGALQFLTQERLTPERAQQMVLGFMTDAQQQIYLRHHDLDFAYEHEELGRFRVNALEQFRGPDIIFRCIPKKVPTLADLGLPASLARFTEWHQGLVLVTGSAGCGKSTTAAALIDLVNRNRKDHIITIEDPIEFLHVSKGCNVTQRQVPLHTKSFSTALRSALREDPDVIMIGEMRDLETVSLAIRAAETGHLVIGTLQTKSAPRTIDRVIDVFPSDQQAQIRTMLAESLRGIIAQQLIPRADGKGRVVALEVLHVNNAVSNLIRDSKTYQLHSLMQTGRRGGQRLMDDSLTELLQQGLITLEQAIKAAENPKHFKQEEPAGAAAGAKR